MEHVKQFYVFQTRKEPKMSAKITLKQYQNPIYVEEDQERIIANMRGAKSIHLHQLQAQLPPMPIQLAIDSIVKVESL